MVEHLLPPGLRGLVVAGLLSALMGSLAGVFNACSTLFTVDLYEKINPGASQEKIVRVGRTATIVMVLIAWKLGGRTWTAFVRDEVTATTIPWPVWLSSLPAAIGCWLFAARALYRCVAHVASAIAGSARVELPPPPLTSREEENPL